MSAFSERLEHIRKNWETTNCISSDEIKMLLKILYEIHRLPTLLDNDAYYRVFGNHVIDDNEKNRLRRVLYYIYLYLFVGKEKYINLKRMNDVCSISSIIDKFNISHNIRNNFKNASDDEILLYLIDNVPKCSNGKTNDYTSEFRNIVKLCSIVDYDELDHSKKENISHYLAYIEELMK